MDDRPPSRQRGDRGRYDRDREPRAAPRELDPSRTARDQERPSSRGPSAEVYSSRGGGDGRWVLWSSSRQREQGCPPTLLSTEGGAIKERLSMQAILHSCLVTGDGERVLLLLHTSECTLWERTAHKQIMLILLGCACKHASVRVPCILKSTRSDMQNEWT